MPVAPSGGPSAAELAALARAVELAARGAGTTSPNPLVGCVLLGPDGATVVGEGWHQRAGGPHAEAAALAVAGAAARGGTALVTLEPCAHTGRTPPCARALLSAGVARVVHAVDDPTPVAGGGAEVLRAAGVDVVGPAALAAAPAGAAAVAAAERVNEAWLTAARRGHPHVLWKFAATLDGRSAAADGSSRWVTGPVARAEVHRLRAAADAVVVGVGTVLADDPQLTARDASGAALAHQPLRVVVDSTGRTPAGARVRDGAAPTWVATAAEVGAAAGGGVDLVALLAALRARGVVSVLLEGGPRLAGAFLAAGLVDRVTAHLAPALLGAGPAALAGGGVATVADALRLDVDDVSRLGPDLRVSGRLPPRRP